MKKLAKILIGSHMFGLETEDSDEDYVEIFKEDNDKLLGLDYNEEVQVNKDYRQYEVGKFLRLCTKANPNMLDILFCTDDCIQESSEEFELIRKNRHKFLTKECKNTYGQYAISQIRKAQGYNKKVNWDKNRVERKDLLDFSYFIEEGSTKVVPVKEWLKKEGYKQEHCGLSKISHFKDCYFVFIDERQWLKDRNERFQNIETFEYKGIIKDSYYSNEVSLSTIPEYAMHKGILYINHDGYSTHCKDYRSYEIWKSNRNENRYITNKQHGQNLDSKNISHCRRLLSVALEIPIIKDIKVRRHDREYLLNIKKGVIDLSKVLEDSEKDIVKLNSLYENSNLPKFCDKSFVNNLLVKIRSI